MSVVLGVRDVDAGGRHVCAFHSGKNDLLELLVPYFLAGLSNGELCMWVISEVINRDEAINSIEKAALKKGIRMDRDQIEILSFEDWYLQDGVFQAGRVKRAWRERLSLALSKGYRCLRITGDTSWLGPEDWDKFVRYEDEIGREFATDPLVAMCTYPLNRVPRPNIDQVLATHQFGVIKRCGEWNLLRAAGPDR
ncbi:MAG: hypothetical protein HPY55_06170 [Firmicutes bacterium]|nr:hypothetical protein [Bacillota bacterium]